MASAASSRANVTCVVADDHPPIIDAVSRYLSTAGFAVLGTALDGESALALVQEHQPTVLVADVRMPRLDGLALAQRIAEAKLDTRVLLYSGVGDRGLVSDALDAGAHGFALKDAPLDDLGRALDIVSGGGLYVDPVLAAQLATPGQPRRRQLSERERQVLRMLAEGGSYAEIGSRLFLSPDTIRAHAHAGCRGRAARRAHRLVSRAVRP
jgi:two-component system response regulator DesR